MNDSYCFLFFFFLYLYKKIFMKDWEKELMEVMSKSNVDSYQTDIINYVNELLTKITKEIYERDPMMGENFKNRFVK